MKQVWYNLIDNAIKFSSKTENPRVRISGKTSEQHITFCVEDNGAGFDMKYYNQLFGVFQRLHTDEEFPGTGVGLAIVKRIVERHGGSIWAESTINNGSKFYFSIPITKKDE